MKSPEEKEDEDVEVTEDELDKEDSSQDVKKSSQGEQLDGKMGPNDNEGLPNHVLETNKQEIDDGTLITEAFDHNIGSFIPDLMFEQMVNNYKNSEKLFGKTMIRELTGYDPKYIDKNVKIPEFQRELKKRVKDKVDDLKEQGLIKESGLITEKAITTAALFLLDENFEKTKSNFSNVGEKVPFTADTSGERTDIRPYKKGDRYKDLAVKQTITRAIKRNRKEITEFDLQTYEKEAKQKINVVYAIDASGSMRGEKLRLAKKSGVSLANKALKDRNDVGLVIFGSEVNKQVELTSKFFEIVKALVKIVPGKETDIALAISKSVELLSDAKGIKHIVLLTDGLHTTSSNPEKEVLTETLKAINQDITLSVVGISLDEIGLKMSQKIVDTADGNLYSVKDLDDMEGIIIADYQSLQ